MWEFIKGLFSTSKDKTIVGGLATDIREAIKGKEIDPNKLIDVYLEVAKLQANVLGIELQGNWLQRSWRPLLMLLIIFVIFNNYILAMYFPSTFNLLPIDDNLWSILEIGLGGYVIGRSLEKTVSIYKNK